MAAIERGILTSGIIATAFYIAGLMNEYFTAIFDLPFFK